MRTLRFVPIENAVANVVRGSASSIVALALPHFLTRQLGVDKYSAWVLMLQIAAYANFLDFGLQTAVARYLTQAIERGDEPQQSRIVSTVVCLLGAGGLLMLILTPLALIYMPHLLPGAPVGLIGELRAGPSVLCASAALSLPLSALTGILISLHRLLGAGSVLAILLQVAEKPLGLKHIPGPLGVRGRNSDNRLIAKETWLDTVATLIEGIRQTSQWIAAQVRAAELTAASV